MKEAWRVFLSSIFYIGKGTRSRPFSHLYEAIKKFRSTKRGGTKLSAKLEKIISIWSGGGGVVCLQIFNNSLGVEALTREAAMIDAIGEVCILNINQVT